MPYVGWAAFLTNVGRSKTARFGITVQTTYKEGEQATSKEGDLYAL